jgi:hypothetical protein
LLRALPTLSCLLFSYQAAAFEPSGSSWQFPTANFTASLIGLSPSGESWSSAFKRALGEWTDQTTFEFSSNDGVRDPCSGRNTSAFGDGVSSAAFTESQCGAAFGANVLAVTLKTVSCPTSSCTGNRTITESDIIFSQSVNWDVYSGPTRNGVRDFYRVALHELGHAIGLEHEPNAAAIMQPFISSLDALQNDDVTGANFIYGKDITFPSIYGIDIILPLASEILAPSGSVTLTGLLSQADSKLDNRPIDIYQFTLASDYSVDMRLSSNEVNPLLYLVRVNSAQVAIPNFSFSNDNFGIGTNSRISTTLPAGTYWAGVTTANSTDFGTYTLSLLANAQTTGLSSTDTFVSVYGATAQVNPNPIITGELSQSDFKFNNRFMDIFQITIDSEISLRFDLSANGLDTRLLLVQVNPDQSFGELSLENDGNGNGTNSSIQTSLLPGTYWLGITSFSPNATGDYRIDTRVVYVTPDSGLYATDVK